MPANRSVNPYIAGSVVTGADMFFGRQDVFSFVRRHLMGLHRDTPLVLYGQRRTGKTSVLYHLPRHLDARYRCVLIDLHGLGMDAGMGSLLWGIATVVSRTLRRDHGVTLAVPDRAAFTDDPRSTFENVFLDAVWAALGDDHLVLMVDEVARLEEERAAGRLEPGVFEYLRHLMQHYPNLNFIFSIGSGLEEMERDYSFLFNSSLYHRISFLEPDAARALITEPAKGCYDVVPKAVAKILEITSGHAYYTQLVCHSLFDRWVRDPRAAMTVADVMAVLPEAIELGSANLTFVWEYSTPEEQAMMAAMASVLQSSDRRITAERVLDVWRQAGVTMPEGARDRAIRSLTAREVVVAGGRGYSFCVDLQRLWIKKHRRLSWVKDDLAEVVTAWGAAARAEFDIRASVPAAGQQAQDSAGRTSFRVPDLARLYNFPAEFDGTGECVGIIELGGGLRQDDLNAHLLDLGLSVPRVTVVSVDGAVSRPGWHSDTAVALNVQVVAAAAPGADIAVYFAPNTDRGFTNAVLTAARDTVNNPSVLCITWGQNESSWTNRAIDAMNEALKEAAARGITVCCASGDNGPTDSPVPGDGKPHVDFPASSPYVLACGGTRVSANLRDMRIESETVWNDLEADAGATGGGFSERFPAPDWQRSLVADAPGDGGVAPGRALPDVAMNASPLTGYQIVTNGSRQVVGGTVGSTSMVAALIARLNQGLGDRAGWLNPALYRSLGPAGILRDITEGSTRLDGGSALGHDARPGWDPCTGWGVPDGQRLLEALKVLRTIQPRDTPG
jgi:kumamolisin